MDFVDEFYKDKDLSLLKKLTLVIPTYNRNHYLSRCLWYHAHFPFGQIIAADSSPEEKKIINRQTVEKVREKFGSNILYLEYPPETEKWGGDIHRKWGNAVLHVATEYSVSCTDREFTIPTTQCKCIDFLDSHNDYIGAEGMDYKIYKDFGTKKIIIPWQGRTSLDKENIDDRLNEYLSDDDVIGTQFALFKSQIHKKIYDNLQKYNVDDIRFGETAIEILPIIYGKTMKFPDVPGNVRDSTNLYKHAAINNAESSYTRYPLLNEYPLERYNTIFQSTKKCFHDAICEVSGMDWDDNKLNQILTSLMEKRGYFASTGYQNKLLRKYKSLQYIWESLPHSLQYLISNIFGEGYVSKIETSKVTSEMKLILKIINNLNKYHDADTPIIDVYNPSKK